MYSYEEKKYIAILLGNNLLWNDNTGLMFRNKYIRKQHHTGIAECNPVQPKTQTKTVSEAETEMYTVEVTAISEDSITIKVGTMKQMENRTEREHHPCWIRTDEEKKSRSQMTP